MLHLRLHSEAPPSHGTAEPGPPAPSAFVAASPAAVVAASPAGSTLEAMDQG